MHFIDILSLSLSFLGIYGFVFSLRYLVPCYIFPFLSMHLNATQQLLNHAEAINAIPPESEYRTHLELLANQFAAMRVESNHARGPFKQIRLAIQRCMTYKLYVLCYQVEGMQSKLELAIDERQLRIAESVTTTATPANNVVDPTLPLPATTP